jgi:hypothetical protein
MKCSTDPWKTLTKLAQQHWGVKERIYSHTLPFGTLPGSGAASYMLDYSASIFPGRIKSMRPNTIEAALTP